jgi:hypothetical protein
VNQLVMDRTVSRPAPVARPARSAVDAAATATAPHEVRSVVAVAAGVLAILLLATWSFAQGWGRGPVVGPGELAVDSGIARVDGVIAAAAPKHAMPGMGTDTDPVPEGMRRISLDVTPAAKDWLTLTGYDPAYGARPLRRLVQSAIGDQLAKALLSGDVLDGSVVRVDVDGDRLVLEPGAPVAA